MQARDQAAQPGADVNVDEAFHDDLPGQRPGERRLLPGSQQRDGKQRAGKRDAEDRRQQLVGVVDVGDVLVGRAVKGRRRDDQDGGVDEEGEQQRAGRVDGGELDRLAFARFGLLDGARLDDAGMQVQVVRHDRRAQDTDRDVERRRVEDNLASTGSSPPRIALNEGCVISIS